MLKGETMARKKIFSNKEKIDLYVSLNGDKEAFVNAMVSAGYGFNSVNRVLFYTVRSMAENSINIITPEDAPVLNDTTPAPLTLDEVKQSLEPDADYYPKVGFIDARVINSKIRRFNRNKLFYVAKIRESLAHMQDTRESLYFEFAPAQYKRCLGAAKTMRALIKLENFPLKIMYRRVYDSDGSVTSYRIYLTLR